MAVALMARERNVAPPVHILSVYPIADGDTVSPSYNQYAMAKPLGRSLMGWFFKHYLSSPADARNPLISLVNAEMRGMPPVTIINAQIDPLLSDGQELAEHLHAAGVDVEQQTFPGVTHEFFGMAAVVQQAQQAQMLAVRRLRQSFDAVGR